MSHKLDVQLKKIAQQLSADYTGFSRGHNRKKPVWEHIYTGCVPDGGLWLDNDNRVRVAVEAKVQGNHGNAQERHAKNYIICKSKRSRVGFKYITFMAGAGAMPDGVLDRYARTMLYCENAEGSTQINVLHPEGVSFFLSPTGWTDDEIAEIMRQALQ